MQQKGDFMMYVKKSWRNYVVFVQRGDVAFDLWSSSNATRQNECKHSLCSCCSFGCAAGKDIKIPGSSREDGPRIVMDIYFLIRERLFCCRN